MNPFVALACWERAAEEEFGIILTVDEKDKREVERALYKARSTAKNPNLEQLMIARPGDNLKEIWIVKKTTDMSDIT